MPPNRPPPPNITSTQEWFRRHWPPSTTKLSPRPALDRHIKPRVKSSHTNSHHHCFDSNQARPVMRYALFVNAPKERKDAPQALLSLTTTHMHLALTSHEPFNFAQSFTNLLTRPLTEDICARSYDACSLRKK